MLGGGGPGQSTAVPGSPRSSPGPLGVRSLKVQRVILSVRSVLPCKGKRESSRKLKKVGESSRRLETD